MSTVNVLKFRTIYSITFLPKFYFLSLFLKILGGKANSVDPNQTAPSVWSGSALFTYAILLATLVYEIFGHLPYPQHMFSWKNKRNIYFLDLKRPNLKLRTLCSLCTDSKKEKQHFWTTNTILTTTTLLYSANLCPDAFKNLMKCNFYMSGPSCSKHH